MRQFAWGVVLASLVCGVFALLWSVMQDRPAAPARADVREAPRDETLHRRHRELESRLRALETELASLREAVRTSFTVAADSPDHGAGDKTTYLDRYLASFGKSDGGSEYFRLAVDAHAPLFVDRMTALVADPDQPAALRVQLIGILGTERFRGDGRVVDTLVGLLDAATPTEIATPALAALATTADAAAIPALERYLDSAPWSNLPYETFDVIAELAGEGRNAVLRRLLMRARDGTARAMVLDRADRADPEGALLLFADAWTRDQSARLAAAARLGRFRTGEFKRFVEEKLAAESDPEVRARLETARTAQNTIPGFDPMQATGRPDAKPDVDDPKAWASKRGDMGVQWLELTYRPARRASVVRIFEVNSAGAVVEVQTVDTTGTRRTVWRGTDPTPRPGVFEVRFAPTPYRVARVRIVLDTDRRAGWNEIDAVELAGPDGRAWADTAIASSTYAD